MLKYVKGDLIEAARIGHIDVIAHCCNCFCAMGSGIAPQIAKAFPDAKVVDDVTRKGDAGKLGKFTLGLDWGVSIYNLYGQYGFWKKEDGSINLNYYHLAKALEAMVIDLKEKGDDDLTIGFPKIGCGLAGGDWEVVSQIIETVFDGFDVTIYEL